MGDPSQGPLGFSDVFVGSSRGSRASLGRDREAPKTEGVFLEFLGRALGRPWGGFACLGWSWCPIRRGRNLDISNVLLVVSRKVCFGDVRHDFVCEENKNICFSSVFVENLIFRKCECWIVNCWFFAGEVLGGGKTRGAKRGQR